MKKFSTIMMVALLAMVSFSFTACDDGNDYDDYYDDAFNLNNCVDGYLSKYGAFGTDDNTTATWFNNNYENYGGYGDYYYEADYKDFINALDKVYQENQVAMASIISSAAWSGKMTIHWRDNSNQSYSTTDGTAEYDFDLSQSGGVSGRGLEKRGAFSDGSAAKNTAFNWKVDGFGNIILDFDSEAGQGQGVEMVIYYADLNLNESSGIFAGTMTSNTKGLDEYDDFSFNKVTYAKSNVGTRAAVSNKIFNGAGTTKRLNEAQKTVSITGMHR
jgi:hypothetical protein